MYDNSVMSLDISFNNTQQEQVDDLIARCLNISGVIDINLDGINVNSESSWDEVSKSVSEDILGKIVGMGYVYIKYSDLLNIHTKENLSPNDIYVKIIRYNNKLQKWTINKSKHILEEFINGKTKLEKCYYFWKTTECSDSTRKMMEHLLKGLDDNTITFTFKKS